MFRVLTSKSGIPIIVDKDTGQLQRDASQWLLNLIHIQMREFSYVSQIAYRMVSWLEWQQRYLNEHNCDRINIYNTYTRMLTDYRDYFLDNTNNKPASVNLHISTVCAFYWHAQEQGWCGSIIGWNNLLKNKSYLITVGKGKKDYQKYTIPFLVPSRQSGLNFIPTARDVEDLKEKLRAVRANGGSRLGEELTTRNILMVRWMSEVSLRRKELVNLSVTDIPAEYDDNKMVEVVISRGTKNSSVRRVLVAPSLIRDTLDFIRYDRTDIFSSFGDQAVDHGTIFMSMNKRTGGRMAEQSVTNMLNLIDTQISPHALRRYGLTRYAGYLFAIQRRAMEQGERREIDVRRVELELCQQAGHKSFSTTLKHYIDLARTIFLSNKEHYALEEYSVELEATKCLIGTQIEASKLLTEHA